MRRKLNLNEPSSKILVVIGLFLFVIPLVLFTVHVLLQTVGVSAQAVQMPIMISFALGILGAAVFGLLVIAEQIQDRWYDQSYSNQKDRKVKLADNSYECQYCGNRQVSASDRVCHVCGKSLR